MIENFLSLSIKAASLVVKIDDADALKAELKKRFQHQQRAFSVFWWGYTKI